MGVFSTDGRCPDLYRLIAREFGADLVVSEMISAQPFYENKRTLQMLATEEAERPVAIQLFGHKPAVMAEAAQIVIDHCRPEMIG